MDKRVFKKVIITGASGSGGSYLADYIVEYHPEVELHGVVRWHSTTSTSNLNDSRSQILLHECDLNDLSNVVNVLKEVRPDAIFHLASYANVRTSFITPIVVMSNNIVGTHNLLEGIRLAGIDPVLQICSTSEVYGQVDEKNVPIKEDCPLHPSSPYAVSKTTQDLLGFAYWRSYGLKIIRTRMFAYLNPRREDLFATSFAKQVAEIEVGRRQVLLHGNLDSVRTLIDVRDAMTSYWIAVERCVFGEAYNIGGITVMKVGDFLEMLKKIATCPIPTKIDPTLLRPSDVTLQIPDTTKFTAATGWKPQYSFEESLRYLLEYWRKKIKSVAN